MNTLNYRFPDEIWREILKCILSHNCSHCSQHYYYIKYNCPTEPMPIVNDGIFISGWYPYPGCNVTDVQFVYMCQEHYSCGTEKKRRAEENVLYRKIRKEKVGTKIIGIKKLRVLISGLSNNELLRISRINHTEGNKNTPIRSTLLGIL